MQLMRLFLYLLLIIFFSSCSFFHSLQSEQKVECHISTDTHIVNSHSKNSSEKKIVTATPKPKEIKMPESEKESEPKKPERFEMNFSDVESAHVRLMSGTNNPFAGIDGIVIPLATLASEFCYPLKGKLISPYGMRGRSMHTGCDLKTVPRDTIRAAFAGVIRMSKPYSGYGNVIVVRHYNGLETLYSHNVKNLVDVNDVVEAGAPIALVGRTGTATTEHLHFELRIGGVPVNPTLILDTDNHTLRSDDTLYIYRVGSTMAASNHRKGVGSDISSSSTKNIASANIESKGSPVAVYRTIKKGDTLYQLARSNNTTVEKICALNDIKPTKTLQLKEKIRVK